VKGGERNVADGGCTVAHDGAGEQANGGGKRRRRTFRHGGENV